MADVLVVALRPFEIMAGKVLGTLGWPATAR